MKSDYNSLKEERPGQFCKLEYYSCHVEEKKKNKKTVISQSRASGKTPEVEKRWDKAEALGVGPGID